jgi:hypothetical protein
VEIGLDLSRLVVALSLAQLVAGCAQACSRNEVPLHVLHKLRTILHRCHTEAGFQQHLRGRIRFQLIEDRNDIDQ